jgi:hypothetical protein
LNASIVRRCVFGDNLEREDNKEAGGREAEGGELEVISMFQKGLWQARGLGLEDQDQDDGFQDEDR